MTFQYNSIGLRLLSFFIFFLFGIVPWAVAQAWNPFPVGAPIVYSNYVNFDPMHQSGTTNYFAVRIDSVRQEGIDSAYYHFRIDRPFHEAEYRLNCNGDTVRGWRGIKLNEQHFMGEKMLRSSDGTCRFVFAVNPDTFVLKTFASVGESWTWHGNTVATVTQIRYQDVAGVMDSVKYIQLSDAPDIQLSRRFGFVQVFNFGPFAPCYWYGCAFKLVGKPSGANVNEMLPTFREIFDFQAGDVLQYNQNHHMPSTQRDYDLTTEYTFQSSDPGNEFVYGTMMQQNYKALRPDAPDGYRLPMRVTLNFDHAEMAYLDLLPYEHNPAISNSNWAPVQAGASTTRYGMTSHFRFWNAPFGGYLDTCGQFYVIDDLHLYRSFAAGLGKVSEYWTDSVGVWNEAMNCYRKLENSWGDCEILRTELFADSTGEMFLYPNPTKETVHVLLNPTDSIDGVHLVIYSATGAKLRMYEINPMNVYFELDVADLRPGLYLVGLEGNGKRRQTKRLVILR